MTEFSCMIVLEFVWFLFLKIIIKNNFGNIKNIILVFSKKCPCYWNLVFFMKNKKKKKEPNAFNVSSLFFKTKNKKQTNP